MRNSGCQRYPKLSALENIINSARNRHSRTVLEGCPTAIRFAQPSVDPPRLPGGAFKSPVSVTLWKSIGNFTPMVYSNKQRQPIFQII